MSFLFVACSKRHQTWRDYGDYYSFMGGFYLDGVECHFPEDFFYDRGDVLKVNLFVYDSIIDLRFRSNSWLITPKYRNDNCIRCLDFDVRLDSLTYNETSNISVKPDFFNEGKEGLIKSDVHFYYYMDDRYDTDGWGSYDFVEGWVSFDLGEMIGKDYYNQKSYNIHGVSRIQFEFSFESDGSIHTITDGYCYPKDRNIITYYSLVEL